jgi:hypothetical protein
MAYKTSNIIHGAAAIYFSTLSSVSTGWQGSVDGPAPAPTTPYTQTMEAATTAWRAAGYTQDGVDVDYVPTFKDIDVDQLLDAAVIFKTKQTVTVKTTLKETTLENLQVVWGMPDNAVTGTDGAKQLALYEGVLGEQPVERSMIFVGPGPRTATNALTERVYSLRRVLQTQSSAHMLKRDTETIFPVSFRCLPDPRSSYTGKAYGTIQERTFS